MADFNKAIELLQRGDWDGAISILKNVSPSFQVCNLLGVAHQMKQDWAGAVDSWERALSFEPTSEDARLNVGIGCVAIGDKERAEKHWSVLLEGNSEHVQALINLGILYREQERNMLAHNCWERALKILPTHPKVIEWLADVKGALGIGYVALGEVERAESLLKKAVVMDPEYAVLWGYLSEWHLHKKEYPEALVTCRKAIELDEANSTFYHTLGNVYRMMGSDEEALVAYRKAMDCGGRHVSTLQAIAELTESDKGENIAVVEQLFDQYAVSFDAHLLQELEYAVPQQAFELLTETVDQNVESVLDLGCGTGLSMYPFLEMCTDGAKRVGVDVSENMLAQAHTKGFYTDLVCMPITEYLEETIETFDLIVCLDALVYCRDLCPIFQGIADKLATNGYALVSTETTNNSTPTLQRTGRYAHPVKYIQDCVASVELSIVSHQTVRMRKDGLRWVKGDVWLLAHPLKREESH